MVQVRDLVIGGGNFNVESGATAGSSAAMFADTLSVALGNKMQRDADAFNIKAETDLQLFGIESLQKTISEAADPEQITPKFFETYQQKYNELLESAPNQVAKDRLSQTYENLRGSFGQRAINAQADQTQNMRVFGVQESVDKIGQAMLGGAIDYKTARDMANNATKQSEGFLGPTKRHELKKQSKQKLAEIAWQNTPDNVKYQVLNNAAPEMKGGFEAAMQMVHANEGGFAASDGASGQPVMMGINRGSHKKAFDEIMQIYNTKGEAAAKQYADNFYKEQYWDKNGIDKLPENVQAIVMDGVVNHWSGFQKELVNAAKNGASPAQLIEMRRKEYDRLVNSPGENNDFPWQASAAGWEARMNNLETAMFGKTGTAFDDLDVTDKVRAIDSVRKYAQENEKLKVIDYGEYARRNGMDIQTAMANQAGRPYVQIVPNTEAKTINDSLKNYQNVDDFINFSMQFKQQYAGAEIPAVKNLVENGLEPEMSTAMMMAVKDPNQYRPHIEAIFNWKNNNAIVKQNLADRGQKENDIEIAVSKVWDDSDQRLAMEKKYGKGRPDELKKAMQAAAKGYMAFNPAATKDEAADFAAQPFLEEYEIGKIRGQVFNVPQGSNAAQAERRLERFYEEKLIPMYGENFKLDFLSPVLNDTEDGFYFVDPLYNRVKLPGGQADLMVSFSELLNFEPTPNAFERRSMEKITYKQSTTPSNKRNKAE